MSAKFIITMNTTQLLTWGGYRRLFPDGSVLPTFFPHKIFSSFSCHNITISSHKAHLHSLQCTTIRGHSPATLCEPQYVDMYYQWRQEEMEMVLKAHGNSINSNNVVELSKIPVTFTYVLSNLEIFPQLREILITLFWKYERKFNNNYHSSAIILISG